MMRLILVVLAFALAFHQQPAAAQQPNREVAEMQALLADVGLWTQEYQQVMARAGEPIATIEQFLAILDGFIEGEANAARTAADLEAWRARALAVIAEARAAAHALRPPPSLEVLGPQGRTMQAAFETYRANLPPTIDEFERVVNAVAELGLEALRGEGVTFNARERVLYEATIQLLTVDRVRIDISVASLPRENPNHALMVATQHYYDTLIALPRLAIAEQDGGGNRAETAARLRQSARAMNAELDRGSALAIAMIEQMRAAQGGDAVELVRTVLRALETFPASIAAYRGLVRRIDQTAVLIESGADLRDVMAEQDAGDLPFLNEIDRLERVRAGYLANNRGAL